MFTEEDFYEVEGKVHFKKRKCPICSKDSYIKCIGEDFVEISCVEHPNWLHFIVEDILKMLDCNKNNDEIL